MKIVGLDPGEGRRLVQALRDAEQGLDTAAARVQRLLDAAAIEGCSAPQLVRHTARGCGKGATDLERRTELVQAPGKDPSPWRMPPGGLNRCWPTPVPGQAGPSQNLRSGVAMAITVLGPTTLITPPAPDLGGRRVTMTVQGPSCGTINFAARRPGAGQPVPPPPTLPAFPEATRGRARTPVQGGGHLRRRWKDRDGTVYEWDSQHGTVEKYDRRGRHLGEYDHTTGAQLKPPDPTRRVEP